MVRVTFRTDSADFSMLCSRAPGRSEFVEFPDKAPYPIPLVPGVYKVLEVTLVVLDLASMEQAVENWLVDLSLEATF